MVHENAECAKRFARNQRELAEVVANLAMINADKTYAATKSERLQAHQLGQSAEDADYRTTMLWCGLNWPRRNENS